MLKQAHLSLLLATIALGSLHIAPVYAQEVELLLQEVESAQGEPISSELEASDNAAAVPETATIPEGQVSGVVSGNSPLNSEAQANIAEPVGILSPKGTRAELLPPDMTSVLYTFWEYTALMDAKNSRRSSGVQRGVTQDEIDRELRMSNAPAEPKPKPPPEEREIALGGIVYTSGNDWTIWLNGQRVTPDALPKEIIDLKVQRHYIDVKWLDDYTQRLYPIRLRAHQRFQLDARMFLPG